VIIQQVDVAGGLLELQLKRVGVGLGGVGEVLHVPPLDREDAAARRFGDAGVHSARGVGAVFDVVPVRGDDAVGRGGVRDALVRERGVGGAAAYADEAVAAHGARQVRRAVVVERHWTVDVHQLFVEGRPND